MNTNALPIAKFRCGHLYTTPNALSRITREDILTGIRRHQAGDWGDVNKEDWQTNERALIEGTRLWSVYRATNGTTFWIITEANRQSTTILLPQDY